MADMADRAANWSRISTGAARLASVALLFLVWWAASAFVDDPRLAPGPVTVFAFIARETASGELPYHLGVTLARVGAAFVAAMAIGAALGLAMGRSRTTKLIIEPWILLLL